ncbi:ATP-binding cassette domain-containing protein [Synechococcales cyanobacterium C]|uniref:ATP-binding cassette domain-containing protein n=1 Tax=Petrachloros mirabilis ULC683 TaxID=2781853 RepID=A0A8K2A191_9CYAN|nr:ABC transporter ATP-binding protein [Petrachloros mirabilis]NCJ07577.1 ATP-binding cassette domain-containing protein [Petrachloros mirabilis ULC683]
MKSGLIKRKRPKTVKSACKGLRRIMQRFWPEIRKERFLLTLAWVGLIGEILAQLLEPWPLKLIFDHIIIPDATELPLPIPFLNNLPQLLLLTLLTLGIILATALKAGASYMSLVSLSIASSRIIAEIRAKLYGHLQRLSLSFHSKARNGDLITRIINDIDRLREVTITAAVPLMVNTLTLVSMVGVMFWMNAQLALIGLLVFPLFIFTATKLTQQIHQVARQQRRREGAMAATASEAINAIKVVQALSLEGMLESLFATDNTKSLEDVARTQQLSAGLQRTVEILVALATAVVLWRGVQLVTQGAATPGDLLVFMTYLKTSFKPTKQLAKHMAQIAKATASGERIIDILDTIPEIRDTQGAIEAPAFEGQVCFRNVAFGYEPAKRILNGLSFGVQPGQRVALVGPSGGGKSTLVSLLLRLYDPIEGNILIDGHDLRQYRVESLRRQISIVLQDSVLFAVSVRDNIAYGALGATDAEIEAAARLANAHDFIMALPQGYATPMGERGATLSGGQRQRIAIARAAVRRASIVILDEPTVGLDNENEQAVTEALERLTQDCTTFLITHNLQGAVSADQILYLEQGQILERGSHDELMRLGQRYAALYQIQSAIEHSDHHGSAYVNCR